MPSLFALLVALLLSAEPTPTPAQEPAPEPDPTVDKAFLLVAASPSWDEARSTASQAAQGLALELKMEVEPLPDGGLTFSKKACEGNGWEHPCYVPRGRSDDGEYVSVEYSTQYEGFTPGLYIVVVASGELGKVEQQLAAAKEMYPDAYIKKAPVYMGCMH